MIEILIALLGVTGFGAYVACNANGWDSWFVKDFFGPLALVFGICGLLFYSGMAWFYFAAEYKAEIVNREFGTNYTAQEIFYAEDVIDKIREIKRHRIEVNGDLSLPNAEVTTN